MTAKNTAIGARTLLLNRETDRLKKRDANTSELRSLLGDIPRMDSTKIELAVTALMEAADAYVDSKSMVASDNRRSNASLAEARKSLKALRSNLSKAQNELRELPLEALLAVGQAIDTPINNLSLALKLIRRTVEMASINLGRRPNKASDLHRDLLAYDVAVVFRDILNLKPRSTSEKQLTANMATARGGAAYARVLSATLKAAGVINYDPGPLISAGLRLLKDPALPQPE